MAARVRSALESQAADGFVRFKGLRLGVLCHQASVTSGFDHIIDLMVEAGIDVVRVFGPQHGPWGHTQDNMIEWAGYTDTRTGLEAVSLYGQHRRPTASMLDGLDHLVIDLQDVGCRVYTFVWTMALCMEACAKAGVPVSVFDRPNPIGHQMEGPVLQPGYESFVGMYPVPMRHGMSIGGMAAWLHRREKWNLDLTVLPCAGEDDESWTSSRLPWIPPSPNMPTVDTALVYPGMVLLEGTNVSEGRGTTRPFETFGAPWLDSHALCQDLNAERFPGVHFRPTSFEPTFQKQAGQVCHGGFLHVTDKRSFRPVTTGIGVLQRCRAYNPDAFEWKSPPYEYEETKLPIDVLAGNSWVREAIEQETPLGQIRERMDEELSAFNACQEVH
jgi:uncharacterized protein YbbC (DUF1343 family)